MFLIIVFWSQTLFSISFPTTTVKNKNMNTTFSYCSNTITSLSFPNIFFKKIQSLSPKHPNFHLNKMTQNFSISSSSSSCIDTESTNKPKQQPWLLVGIGNPGKKYIGTRHNVGFQMLDAIAEAEGISVSSVNFKSLIGRGSIGNVPVLLAKPQTYMNLSGESVAPLVSYYKIPVNQVLVIYDDLDLPFAKLRLLPKGGHGGHNGMRSIIDRFKGNRDFPRLRIGIGRPPGKMDPASFVLRPFTKDERDELDFTFQRGIEAVRILMLEGFNKSSTFVNSKKSMEQLS